MVLDVEIYPKMPRKESKAVPEGNAPTPQDACKMIIWKELRRVLSESMGKPFGEFKEDLGSIDQRLASLKQDARQSRLAMEADEPADKKAREHTEGAAMAVQAKHGGSCSANGVDPNPKSSTSFGDDFTGPPALPCSRVDALVGNGATAAKSCLSPLEMRTPTFAGGLLLTDTASKATRTTFDQPPLWFCLTEKTNLRTSIQYAPYNSIFWRINNQQAPFWPRVIEKKSGQNLVVDPGGSTGRLRACPFWKRGPRCFGGRFSLGR